MEQRSIPSYLVGWPRGPHRNLPSLRRLKRVRQWRGSHKHIPENSREIAPPPAADDIYKRLFHLCIRATAARALLLGTRPKLDGLQNTMLGLLFGSWDLSGTHN